MDAKLAIKIAVISTFLLALVLAISGSGGASTGPSLQKGGGEIPAVLPNSANVSAGPVHELMELGYDEGEQEDEPEEAGVESGPEDDERNAEDEEEGAVFLGDWWGLGEEARETPYIGFGFAIGRYDLA